MLPNESQQTYGDNLFEILLHFPPFGYYISLWHL